MSETTDKLKKLLREFANEYEAPYRFMHDNNKTPAQQMHEAQEELIAEALAALEAIMAEEQVESVKDAFSELRSVPKDSWYGTMPEIVERLQQQAKAQAGGKE